WEAEDAGGKFEDGDEVGGLVVVESADEAEAVPQRSGDEARARRRADERESGQVEPDRARRGALADDDVELEILHRRVQDFLDGARESGHPRVEQDVAVV